MGVRELVSCLEQAIVNYLAQHTISAHANTDARGVYVQDAKICSIGLRVRRGCSYHGLAFNVHMDLTPFKGINPCGFVNLPITQLCDLNGPNAIEAVIPQLAEHLATNLGYNNAVFNDENFL